MIFPKRPDKERMPRPPGPAATRRLIAAMTYTEVANPRRSSCTACGLPVTLLGGLWTDEDGCTCCMAGTSAAYAEHKPKEC